MLYKKSIISVMTTLALLGAGLAQAQTSTTTGTTDTTVTTPGAPDTGAGGDVTQNILVLGASGLIALLGAGYLLRSRKQTN